MPLTSESDPRRPRHDEQMPMECDGETRNEGATGGGEASRAAGVNGSVGGGVGVDVGVGVGVGEDE